MQLSMIKKGAAALAVLMVVAALVVAALPWLASTQIVRDRIAYELSIWSGYRVELGEAPTLDVWPSVTATLNDVSLHDWTNRDGPPVLESEHVEIELAALPALRGEIVFAGMKLTRPLLRLTRPGPVVDLPASPGGGRMMHAVETARSLIDSEPTAPDLSALPTDNVGTIEFTDGRVAVVSAAGQHDIVTSLTGDIAWAALNRPAVLSATAIWRGESLAIESSSPQPLILLAGGLAPLKLEMKSTLLGASFNGVANLSHSTHFNGDVSFSTPSLRRILEWSRTEIAPGAAIGAIAISGKLNGNAERLELENVRLDIGGNSGMGVLNASFAESPPSISGTLDFAKLEIGSFLSALSPVASGGDSMFEVIETSFSDQLSLDLRLSAASAMIGSVQLEEVAAAAQVKGNLAAFDISDATAFGGHLQSGLRIDRTEAGKTIEFRLIADQIEIGAMAKHAGMTRLVPHGPADMSVILKGTGDDWETAMSNAEGSVTTTVGQGIVAGLDLAAFRTRLSEREFFALSQISEGQLPVRGIAIEAAVKGGVAYLHKANIMLEGAMIALDGIIPYFGRALALSGHLGPVGEDGQFTDVEASFFIGGAWGAPYVSPILRWNQEQ